MVRSKEVGIRKYFLYSPETDKSECQCSRSENGAPVKCGIQLKGNKSSNLRTHVESRHPHIYKLFLEEEKNNYPKENLVKPKQRLSKFFRERNLTTTTVSIEPKTVIDGIVEMVTVNNRPFTWLSDTGFCRAFDPVLKACGYTLNPLDAKFRDLFPMMEYDEGTHSTNKRSITESETASPSSTKRFKHSASIGKLEEIQKELEGIDDDLNNFGRYVSSSLHYLPAHLCFQAQDEIQETLSKYRLKHLEEEIKCEVILDENDEVGQKEYEAEEKEGIVVIYE